MNLDIELRIQFNQYIDDYNYYNIQDIARMIEMISAKNLTKLINDKALKRNELISILPHVKNISSLRCLKKLINVYELDDLTMLTYNLLTKRKKMRYVKWLYMKHFDKVDWNRLLLDFCKEKNDYAATYLLTRLEFDSKILKRSILACGANFKLIKVIIDNNIDTNILIDLKDLSKLIDRLIKSCERMQSSST